MTTTSEPRAAAAPAPAPPTVKAATPAPPPRRRGVRPQPPAPEGTPAVVGTAVVMIGIVCAWAALQMLVLGGLAHDRAQTLLYREFRVELSQTTAPLGPVTPVGDPVALISIPDIGLDEVVVEGTASGDTLAGPGHLRTTVLPGQEGVSQVFGRSTTYGAPFGRIGELEAGDQISVTTAQGQKTFRVLGVRRDGDPTPAPRADGASRLLLVTAEGDGSLAALTPDRTVYVDAEAAEAFATPPGLPTQAPEAEDAMANDTSALPLLALHLALLVGLSVGVVLARARWSAVLVWTVASPLALTVAWMATDTVMRLLPNLV